MRSSPWVSAVVWGQRGGGGGVRQPARHRASPVLLPPQRAPNPSSPQPHAPVPPVPQSTPPPSQLPPVPLIPTLPVPPHGPGSSLPLSPGAAAALTMAPLRRRPGQVTAAPRPTVPLAQGSACHRPAPLPSARVAGPAPVGSPASGSRLGKHVVREGAARALPGGQIVRLVFA